MATPIDVGSAAITRVDYYPTGTWVDKNNPANDSGHITSVEIYACESMSNVRVGIFSASGNNLTTRSVTGNLGTVLSGAKRTLAVDLDIVAGDYIGVYFTAGGISATNNGSGYWWYDGDMIDCVNQPFTSVADRTISLYGIGVTPVVIPTVTTQAVTNILSTTATGNGNITNTGGENCTKRGICYNLTGNPTVADSKVEEMGSFGTGAFTESLINLSPGTTHHVKAYAYNSAGYGYGAEEDFITLTPTVTTQAVTDILSTTSTGNGNTTITGGQNSTKRGVCWNTTGSPTVANDKSEEIGSFGTGAFTRPMTGLNPNITYYVKAYIYNLTNYYYGAEVSFTTLKTTPTVTVQTPTDLAETTVTANGNITASGGENATVRGFKYGLTQTDTWDAHTDGSFPIGAFTKGLTGLDANTTYWIRAYATNSIGTSYSGWIQFQTAASGTIPTGTKLSICSDYSGYTYKLNSAFTDDGKTYESFFVLSTDLAGGQGLHINKRLLDIFSYFTKQESGTAKIYIKQDNEAEWQYAGEIPLTGDEDIVIPHLPTDFMGKHYLVKFLFENNFEFIGLITESIPIGGR